MTAVQYKSIGDIRQAAAESFVRTAIVIDNEPYSEPRAAAQAPQAAVTVSYGGPSEPEADAGPSAQPAQAIKLGVGAHELPIRPVTNAFAGRKITCGFYFPDEADQNVVETALAAARHVDVTVVDWQLRPKDTSQAKALIAGLVSDDRTAGGRLRLIVVYTAERGLDAECAKLKEHLEAAGLNDLQNADEGRALRGENVLITFANKPQPVNPELEATGPGARPVAWDELPKFVLGQYALLADGLLQSFAMKSIGAIRDDTHHLLSVFAAELDGAYLAQRGGIGTPSDAEEMMTSILISEFGTSITDRRIETEILGEAASVHALKVRAQPTRLKVKEYEAEAVFEKIIEQPKGGGRYLTPNQETLESLLRTGFDANIIKLSSQVRKSLDQHYFSTDEDAHAALARFARLTSFAREADGARGIGRDPLLLTGGMILRAPVTGGANKYRYLLCVQPGCDAVRLDEEVAFPFCPMKENATAFDFVVRSDGSDRFFKVDQKPRNIEMIRFSPDKVKKVVLSESRQGVRGFPDINDVFWEFQAELRSLEAQHFNTLLVGKFNRVALNGSEWLRMHGGRDAEQI